MISRRCKRNNRRYVHDVIFAWFESILYVRNERNQRLDERFNLKNIAIKNAINDEASEQLIVNFFKIWYVVLNVNDRKLEFFDVSWLNIRAIYFSSFLSFVSKRKSLVLVEWHDQWSKWLVRKRQCNSFLQLKWSKRMREQEEKSRENKEVWKKRKKFRQKSSSWCRKHRAICMIIRSISQKDFRWKQCEWISQSCVDSNFSNLSFLSSD